MRALGLSIRALSEELPYSHTWWSRVIRGRELLAVRDRELLWDFLASGVEKELSKAAACRAGTVPRRRPGCITTADCDAYQRKRMREVARSTVTKELSALRGFLAWCKRGGFIDALPDVKSPPKGARGRPVEKGKKVRVHLSPAEVEAIVANLPARTKKGLRPRAFYALMAETSLRKGTLERLEAPGDYRLGRQSLRIRDEIDKARFGRELPLTPRAREILDEIVPEEGLLFGVHSYRRVLEQAASSRTAPTTSRTTTSGTRR